MDKDKLAQLTKANALKNQVKETGFKGMNDDKIVSFISDNYRLKIAQLLPEAIRTESERVIQMCAMVISQNQELKECTPSSIIGAVLMCAMLGFNPNPQFNECFFIPRKKNRKKLDTNGKPVLDNRNKEVWELESINCNFQIGYGGWKKMLYNTGLVRGLEAEAVHIEDFFEDEMGTNRLIKHKRCGKTPTFDTLKCVYMVVRLQGLGVFHHVLYRDKIEQLRLKGCEKEYGKVVTTLKGAWLTDYDEMAKDKIISHMVRHKLPISDTLVKEQKIDKAIASENAIIDIDDANMPAKGLNPVSVESENETENVEVLEVQEVVEENENVAENTEKELPLSPKASQVDKIFQDVKSGKMPITALTPGKGQIALICELILNETISISDVPNKLLQIKDIENAVFSMEQKAALK